MANVDSLYFLAHLIYDCLSLHTDTQYAIVLLSHARRPNEMCVCVFAINVEVTYFSNALSNAHNKFQLHRDLPSLRSSNWKTHFGI